MSDTGISATAHVTHSQREAKYGRKGGVFWLTGLSGAGKSTLAFGVEKRLFCAGIPVAVLDGDSMRKGLCDNLSFSLEDRQENLRRVAHTAALLAELGYVCLCACIAPLAAHRALCRTIVGPDDYHEIFVRCPLAVCRQRDVKGLYAQAVAGRILDYTGMSSPYEEPVQPDLVLPTAEKSVNECLDLLEKFVRERIEPPVGRPLEFCPRLVVFDFDGVFTDNKVYVDEQGCEGVRCCRGDGMGVARVRDAGIPMCILSGETNAIVARRAAKLGIPCVQGCADKATFLREYLQQLACDPAEVIYVGNDINDLSAMRIVGCSMAPADAHPLVRAEATHILTAAGGNGAVRECCDLILDQLFAGRYKP